MSEIQTIQLALERTARRRRWQQGWSALWRGLFAGAALWLAVLGLYKLLPLPEVWLTAAGVAAGALPPIAFALGWNRKPSLAETARWIDDHQHLQERLSTALEVSASPGAGRWRDLLLADAAGRVREFDARKMLPYQLPMISRWALLTLVLAATLGFVPEYRSKAHLQQKREAEIMRETGRQLADLARRTLEHRPPVLEPTQKALDSVKDLGELLGKAQLNRADALRELASVTEKIKDQTRELGRDAAIRRLEQAARTPAGQSQTSTGDVQKQIDSLQQQLGNPNATPDSMDKLRQELQKLQQAAAGLPASDPAGAQAQKEQLSAALSDLAKKAEELGLSMPSLEDAIKALEGGQIDQFLKDLKFAEIDLEKMQALAKSLQQLQMQLAQMGKDLAEQLEKGQATAAQGTLRKMIEQLKAANLSPDQLTQMLAEVDKAVKPGSMYGKVGEFLKQAVGQMQQGDKPNAAQSLADASKELDRLMQQLGDCQSLMANLDALAKAQMCIGNCVGWGQCQGPPRVGPGGKPGSGVGTWSDDNGWLTYAEMTDRWDNSGLERPDMAARGITDREGGLSDALVPTKVKGQISPGGSMPSITLKGVSIKGQSKVAYTEAVATAQSEAQSALSQEQVPRAYQGAVRDYFDDLKD